MQIKTMGVLGNLHTPINLPSLVSLGDSYRLSKSQGYLKLKDNITACIYKSGKVQIYGIKRVQDITNIWNLLLDNIQRVVNIPNADKEPVLKFIVASEKLPYTLNLQDISEKFHAENIEYEPEVFPGLIWKIEGGTCLLFYSGNIVITGPNSEEKVLAVIQELRSKLE